MPVTAYKNGKKQVFSDLGWKLLGKNKLGWQEKAPVVIENTVNKAPNMGPNNPADEDVISNAKTHVVDNTVGKTDEDIKDQNENGSTSNEENGSSNTDPKEEFMKALEGISRNQIKDFFDQEKPKLKDEEKKKVTYSNLAKSSDLKIQLAEYLNYDIVKLQEAAL